MRATIVDVPNPVLPILPLPDATLALVRPAVTDRI
jgi:hypothetical protein